MSIEMETVPVGPLRITVATPSAAVAAICETATAGLPGHVHLVNAYTLSIADRDQAYRRVLSGDAVNLPDGKPITWVSQLRRDRSPLVQVRGPRLFLDVLEASAGTGLRHFLLGSSPEVLAEIVDRIGRDYPKTDIVGLLSPPFRPLTTSEVASQDRAIIASRAQIVWVGLGTPKQDFEASRLARELNVLAIAVGAAFDFAAGAVPEAPTLMQKLGLEWLFRLMTEPRRLWRRYLFGNVDFLRAVLRSGDRAEFKADGGLR